MTMLSPKDFGLVGMITVVTGFISALGNTGLGSSLIFKKKLEEIDISTVFVFNLFLGGVFSVLTFLLAKPIAYFYEDDALISLTRLVSILFIINSSGFAATALMRKELRFKQTFIMSVVSSSIGAIVALSLAYMSFGPYSLIWQLITVGLVSNFIALWFSGYGMKFKYSKLIFKEHMGYGLPLLGNSIFNYWSKNSDNLIIGKFLGSDALGLYSRSYTFMMLPARRVTVALTGVLFPTLVKIKESKEILVEKFSQFNALVALVITPIMAILVAIAYPLVNTLMGFEWIEMCKSFQILCVAGWMMSASMVSSKMFLVLGITKKLFRLTVFTGVLAIGGFIIGSQHSIEMVAFIYVLVTIITLSVTYYILAAELETSYWIAIKELATYFILFLILASLGLFIVNFVEVSAVLHLTLAPLSLSLVYSGLIYLFKAQDFNLGKRLFYRYVLKRDIK
jgi:PST family polysaccharide transporter